VRLPVAMRNQQFVAFAAFAIAISGLILMGFVFPSCIRIAIA
jgi:hypothetical protein